MGILKHYVRNRAHPEGSIVEGYVTEEVVEFSLDFMARLDPIGVPRSIHEGMLEGYRTNGKKKIQPTRDEYHQAHFIVLDHRQEVSPYLTEHKDFLRSQYPNRRNIDKLHSDGFSAWFKNKIAGVADVDPMIVALAKGPMWEVRKFEGYRINGYIFATKNRDNYTKTQNSGVCVEDHLKVLYYGYI